ncbi:hypothetical protein [Aliivibrio finisterrensis]|uniref:Glutaredoxin n=1 Tax=Aliivibrio finisterrensis TaxID=511998 RepID=A0ABY0I5X7_9GAMM|nr:hypothetical protein [Aliivibrio finisterrensis]RYU64287.1 hypothetical protein ERW53_10115 [Aliivibrio finisterrensis]RYU83899.1 hypothetical protein ERW52_11955 [Aliivibrio finisterrensis]
MTQTLSLKEHRCPYAMSITRRAIELAMSSGFTGLIEIETIEHAMENHIQQFINSYELPIKINECYNVPLTKDKIDQWCEEDDAITEDFIGLDKIYVIQLDIKTNSIFQKNKAETQNEYSD